MIVSLDRVPASRPLTPALREFRGPGINVTHQRLAGPVWPELFHKARMLGDLVDQSADVVVAWQLTSGDPQHFVETGGSGQCGVRTDAQVSPSSLSDCLRGKLRELVSYATTARNLSGPDGLIGHRAPRLWSADLAQARHDKGHAETSHCARWAYSSRSLRTSSGSGSGLSCWTAPVSA